MKDCEQKQSGYSKGHEIMTWRIPFSYGITFDDPFVEEQAKDSTNMFMAVNIPPAFRCGGTDGTDAELFQHCGWNFKRCGYAGGSEKKEGNGDLHVSEAWCAEGKCIANTGMVYMIWQNHSFPQHRDRHHKYAQKHFDPAGIFLLNYECVNDVRWSQMCVPWCNGPVCR